VDPVPDPLLLRKSDSAGNRTRPLDHRGGLERNVEFKYRMVQKKKTFLEENFRKKKRLCGFE
jgi:hypothetical protein